MALPGVDPEKILGALLDHGVDFVVVGGFALEMWDVAVPPTVDVDITPERSRENLERLAGALAAMGAALRVTGNDPVVIPGGFNAEMLASMEVLNLTTEFGPLDLTVIPAGTAGFEDLRLRAVELPVGAIAVQVAHLVDIARSKEAAGRAKDIAVLPAILDHLRRRR